MRLNASELHYVGGDHWAAILDSIAELKRHSDGEEQFRRLTSTDPVRDDDEDTDNANLPASTHSLLLYGGYRQASRAEILAALPPKNAVDRYISRYFNRQELVSCECTLPAEVNDRLSNIKQLQFMAQLFSRR